MLRRNAETDRRAARGRARGGDVREGAVVQIEQCALSPLEEDFLSGADKVVKELRSVGDERSDLAAVFGIRLADRFRIDGLRIFQGCERPVLVLDLRSD